MSSTLVQNWTMLSLAEAILNQFGLLKTSDRYRLFNRDQSNLRDVGAVFSTGGKLKELEPVTVGRNCGKGSGAESGEALAKIESTRLHFLPSFAGWSTCP